MADRTPREERERAYARDVAGPCGPKNPANRTWHREGFQAGWDAALVASRAPVEDTGCTEDCCADAEYWRTAFNHRVADEARLREAAQGLLALKDLKRARQEQYAWLKRQGQIDAAWDALRAALAESPVRSGEEET